MSSYILLCVYLLSSDSEFLTLFPFICTMSARSLTKNAFSDQRKQCKMVIGDQVNKHEAGEIGLCFRECGWGTSYQRAERWADVSSGKA